MISGRSFHQLMCYVTVLTLNFYLSKNDLCQAADKTEAALLVLLDLLAAFDTVNYSKLLPKLKEGFGITGGTLQ